MKIRLKRVYDPTSEADGVRFFIDRLWPRGISKEDLGSTIWLKEIAPSSGLRKWFNHDPERWPEFRNRYLAELHGMAEPVTILCNAIKNGPVTLLYGARDEEHNMHWFCVISSSTGFKSWSSDEFHPKARALAFT